MKRANRSPKQPDAPGFFKPVLIWTAGLTTLAFINGLIVGLSPSPTSSVWSLPAMVAGWIGLFLPFAGFAGGLALHALRSPRAVVLRGLFLSALTVLLLGYVRPLAEYQAEAHVGVNVSVRFPTGPATLSGLIALRRAVSESPAERFRFRVDRPMDVPPNWYTHLIHTQLVVALFAVLAALLGYLSGFLTAGLSPPARWNARWALGLFSALAFFLPLAAGGNWVQRSPQNSGVAGAWLPLLIPLLELALVTLLVRRQRRTVLHSPEPPGV